MRKTLLIATAMVVMTTGTANAGIWDYMKGSSLKQRNPDAAYAVEVAGVNIRVYEFTPVSQPTKTCVMAFGTESVVGIQCFDKATVSKD